MPTAANPALDFLDEHFPFPVRRQVPGALRRAYHLVDDLVGKTHWLRSPSARFQRGDLIVLAVEHEFEKLALAGVLPFDPVYEEYAAPTGKHLVLRNGRACVTINQIADRKKPRKAVFRNQLGLPNKDFLFEEWNQEIRNRQGARHALLLHGYQDLNFALFGVPDPSASRLIEWTDNLLKIPHPMAGSAEEGPRESPDPESMEAIIRLVNDNDDTI
jgi:hypothetical protein